MDWLKLHHEVLDDPILQGLPAEDFKGFMNLQLIASRNSPRGQLPPLPQLAHILHASLQDAEALCARLVERGLLERQRGRLVIYNWSQRQPTYDYSTPRVQRYRKKKRSRNGETVETVETVKRRREERRFDEKGGEKEEQKAGPSGLVLPDWLPAEPWEAFLDMRRKKRKAATDKAQELLIGKLDRLRTEGFSPAEVLDRSTMNSWTDLYPLKDEGKGGSNGPNGTRRDYRTARNAVRATPGKYANLPKVVGEV